MIHRLACAIALLVLVTPPVRAQEKVARGAGTVGPNVPAFDVRAGYHVTLAAEDFGEARFLEFDDRGTLFVSQPGGGRRGGGGTIRALRDADNDGVFETRSVFVSDKAGVHSMHFFDGWLYYTSSLTGGCERARDTDNDGKADETQTVLPEGSVPKGGGHPYRGICVTPKHIYISVSDPSNMTEELETDRKSVFRFNRDESGTSAKASGKMKFAHGIRNTEKLRLRPGTEELWGVDHGSDWFGRTYGDTQGNQPITDLNPPEELNHLVEGGFYGHPYLVGNRVPRPEFVKRPDLHELAARTIPPAWSFGAHWAGNGFCFLEKDHFPGHKGDVFVAFHGSWNSERRVGYRVERVLFDEQTGLPYGSLQVVGTLGPDGRAVLARPVDCVEAPDGSVLFSCDHTRRIFRISKGK